ncbi:MAG: DUF1579 family protein [Planctomycetes bacterium]|nr:DUF1579 family protein [Planctomycetota bacterium]
MKHALRCGVLLVRSLLVVGPLFAQDAPKPAPELQKLAPLVGQWQGAGSCHESGKTSKWQATGNYRWVLDGFWLQGDFSITFDGIDTPMFRRMYLGWDAEQKRMVSMAVDNTGTAGVHELAVQADGSVVQMAAAHQNGMDYTERSTFKVDGDKLSQTVDLLMPFGASMQMVEGSFQRQKEAKELPLPEVAFSGAAVAEPMRRVGAWAGKYSVVGSMVPLPGMPETKIEGVDEYRTLFGGVLLHCHTDGQAEGMSGKYASEAFFAHDAKRGCLVGVFVSNMGEVGCQEARYTADGKSLVSTMATLFDGQNMVQRAVFDLDAEGRPTAAAAHALYGAAAPYVNFRATYRRQ